MITRRRALAALGASVVVVGMVVATLPHQPQATQAVGTSGPATTAAGPEDQPTGSAAAAVPASGPLTVGTPSEAVIQAATADGSVTDTSATTGSTVDTTAPTATVRTTGTTVRPADPRTSSPSTTSTTAPALRTLAGRVTYEQDVPSPYSVWTMLPDGRDRRLLPECPADAIGFNSGIDVSPDGTQIVRGCGTTPGQATGTTEPGYGLVVQAVDGSATKTLLPLPVFATVFPRWSPDGREIAVVTAGPGVSDVTIVDVVTGGTRTITPTAPFVGEPTWSPDGTLLLMGNLVVLDVVTGATTKLSQRFPNVPGTVTQGAQGARWAPSGWIYFAESADDVTTPSGLSFDRIDPVSGTEQRLFDIPDFLDYADFLPNGRILLRWSRTQVATFDADGGNRELIESAYDQLGFVSPRTATSP